MKSFFEQSSGLRSVDALGPFRDFRKLRGLDSEITTSDDDGEHDVDVEPFDGEALDAIDARDAAALSDQPFKSDTAFDDDAVDGGIDSQDAAAADISGFIAGDPAGQPLLIGCHFAWVGPDRRFVASVGNYSTFEELQRHYDLDDEIAFAQRHVEEMHNYLFKPVTPEPTTVLAESPATRPTAPSDPQSARDACPTTFLCNQGPGSSYPPTPESRSPATTDFNDSNSGLAGLTLELTVRAENGPATATVSVGFSPAVCQQWRPTPIPG